MLDIVISLLLSTGYSVIGGIFSVENLQSIFYFFSSVISSENAVVAVVPTALLLGAGAVVSLVTSNTRRFHPRPAINNNNGGGFFSYQGLFYFFLGIAFCIFIRWPVTSMIMIIFGVAQAYLGWIPIEPSWKLLAQATMTWIFSAIVAHHTTKAFKSGYKKVIHTFGTAFTSLAVGVFRIIYSTVTWIFRLILGLLFPSHLGYDSKAEEAEVEHEVEHEMAAASFFNSDHQFNYDMDDYVYDSDYDHEGEGEDESDVEYDSDRYELDDDRFTAPTYNTEESSLEDWYLDEPDMEEVHENGTLGVSTSTYDLMSGAAPILRCSLRLRGKSSPCYTKGRIDCSMRCN